MSTVTEPRKAGRGCVAPAAIALVLLVVAALGLALLRPALFGLGKESISEEQIGASFRHIAEVSVEEYAYTNVGSFDQEGFVVAGRSVPFTGRKFLVTYDGSVKAGLRNAEDVSIQIDENARTVSVRVPHAEITENTIDPASITVYDQSMNPLNQVRVDDVTGFLAEQERRAAEKATKSGLLQRADERTQELMRSHAEALIEGTTMADYAVDVNWL